MPSFHSTTASTPPCASNCWKAAIPWGVLFQESRNSPRRYGVARVTIRRALTQLEAEGLVVRHASRGTYPVEAATLAEPRANISGLLENLVTVGAGTSARLLCFETVVPPPDIAARLGSDEPALRIERLRLAGRTPVSHYTHYLPHRTAAAVDRMTLGRIQC